MGRTTKKEILGQNGIDNVCSGACYNGVYRSAGIYALDYIVDFIPPKAVVDTL